MLVLEQKDDEQIVLEDRVSGNVVIIRKISYTKRGRLYERLSIDGPETVKIRREKIT